MAVFLPQYTGKPAWKNNECIQNWSWSAENNHPCTQSFELYLSVYLSIDLSFFLCLLYLFFVFFLSCFLSFFQLNYLSVCLSIYLSVHLSSYFNLSICLCFFLSVFPFSWIHPSIRNVLIAHTVDPRDIKTMVVTWRSGDTPQFKTSLQQNQLQTPPYCPCTIYHSKMSSQTQRYVFAPPLHFWSQPLFFLKYFF